MAKTTRRVAKPPQPTGLTHFNAAGQAHMVEVSAKPETARVAIAQSRITMARATAKAIAAGSIGKGDVLAVARLGATKRTAELIPLCHPLRITGVDVVLKVDATGVTIEVTVRAFDRTGVEMEALTAAAVAALTIYDMCKAIDRGMEMGPTRLQEKQGGRSGTWRRTAP
jgi:cyclic pyranopterin monophosphate synthase